MWSSLWEDAAVTTEVEESREDEVFNNITAFDTVEEMEIAKVEVKQEKEEAMVTENGEIDNKPSDSSNSVNENLVEAEEIKEKPVISSQIESNGTEQKLEVTESEAKEVSANPTAPQENPSNFGSELAEYFSSEGNRDNILNIYFKTKNYDISTIANYSL